MSHQGTHRQVWFRSHSLQKYSKHLPPPHTHTHTHAHVTFTREYTRPASPRCKVQPLLHHLQPSPPSVYHLQTRKEKKKKKLKSTNLLLRNEPVSPRESAAGPIRAPDPLLFPIRPPCSVIHDKSLLSAQPCSASPSFPPSLLLSFGLSVIVTHLQAFIPGKQSASNILWICILVNSAAVALSLTASAALSKAWAANKCLLCLLFFFFILHGLGQVPLSGADCSQGWDFRKQAQLITN